MEYKKPEIAQVASAIEAVQATTAKNQIVQDSNQLSPAAAYESDE